MAKSRSYAEIASAYITLIPTLKGSKKTITNELNSVAGDAGTSSGKKAGGNMSSGIIASVKNIALGNILADLVMAGAGKVKDAISNIFGGAFEGFKNYEQLVGGVDTLFKDSSKKLQDYAAEAYMTAQMSANDYMKLTTDFSARLIQSLQGDTDKAVDLANMALIDMSDNAAKMGTPLEQITGAYQSLARGNFGMLDNLKLGYGGTGKELVRLLYDSGVVDENWHDYEYDTVQEALEAAGGFATIVKAIHKIQENLGITGTTALEAQDTVEGSLNMLSAAWENYITGIGRNDADMGVLTENLLNSFTSAMMNCIPRYATVVANAIVNIPALVSEFSQRLPELAAQMDEQISAVFANTPMEGVYNWLKTAFDNALIIFDWWRESLQPIIGALGTTFERLFSVFTNTDYESILWKFVGNVAQLFQTIAPTVEYIIDLATDLVMDIIPAIGKIMPSLMDAIQGAAQLAAPLLSGLAEGLFVVIDGIIKWLPDVINTVLGFITELFTQLQPAFDVLGTLFSEICTTVMETFMPILQQLFEMLTPFIETMLPLISELISNVVAIARDLFESLWPVIEKALGFLMTVFETIWPYLEAALWIIGEIVNVLEWAIDLVIIPLISGLFDAILDFFEFLWNAPQSIADAFTGLVDMIVGPIKDAINWLIGIWNDTVGQISFEVPDWVPGIGGQTIGVPQIPMLADGGVVKQATAAIVGESGPEAVVPLDHPEARSYIGEPDGAFGLSPQEIKDAIREGMEGIGFNIDGKKFARATHDSFDTVNGNYSIYSRRGLAGA